MPGPGLFARAHERFASDAKTSYRRFVFLPFVAGCLTYGSKSATPSGTIGPSLESLVIVYGPMVGMLAWLTYREKVREENTGKHDAELRDVIVQNAEAMTLATAAIARFYLNYFQDSPKDSTSTKTAISKGIARRIAWPWHSLTDNEFKALLSTGPNQLLTGTWAQAHKNQGDVSAESSALL